MANFEELLRDQMLANAKLTTRISSLETMVASLAAEISLSGVVPSLRLEEILAAEENAAIAAITDAGLENPITREIYTEKAAFRKNLAEIARLALRRLLTTRG
ncbi:hypothetical protein JQK15_04020 [Sphingobium sp. BHU LFT2]|uniref:hypothetical protein n=1 Tax=Sphingobium sp. BHU LFT2 TaxID=2807634 RepID=UPI001BECFFB5|nr:hypothetical protein [Sphingobium sp. BHU LFT2]MBT2242696.1 hypothetical protein [Sphingobium sp. BHU LFT2]